MPRMFIFLPICRALLGALGVFYLLEWAASRLGGRRLPLGASLTAAFWVLIALKLPRMDEYLLKTWAFDASALTAPSAEECAVLSRPLRVWYQRGITPEDSTNGFFRVAYRRSQCPPSTGEVSRNLLLLTPGSEAEYQVIQEPPGASFVPLIQGDRTVGLP